MKRWIQILGILCLVFGSVTQVALGSEVYTQNTVVYQHVDMAQLSKVDKSKIVYASPDFSVYSENAQVVLVYKQTGECVVTPKQKLSVLPHTGTKEVTTTLIVLGSLCLIGAIVLGKWQRKRSKMIALFLIFSGANIGLLYTNHVYAHSYLMNNVSTTVQNGRVTHTPENIHDCYEYVGYILVKQYKPYYTTTKGTWSVPEEPLSYTLPTLKISSVPDEAPSYDLPTLELKSSVPNEAPNYSLPTMKISSVPDEAPNYELPKLELKSSVPNTAPNYSLPTANPDDFTTTILRTRINTTATEGFGTVAPP
ncbi:hypothetical protein GMA11_00890 [Granulicatella sp. zg-ZJ]|uniref:LPXTG cell wall anchor domain-containing protein n=1 Tax=Granulicatella sp. zg-ZJ TaxID=2678504 RepID=UPI0013D74704|nr:LPXTG cell wall anchor domain-containing protein [Granulicatella sp. zg-ZJ]NEW61939.1 hypothetical protein [Granulicatella sp. zg-ZJ]